MSLFLLMAFAAQVQVVPPSNWVDIIHDQQATQAARTAERQSHIARDNEAAAERRAKAYAQVGELIAAGKCDEAKRLAAFYDKPDIIKDTAKACP